MRQALQEIPIRDAGTPLAVHTPEDVKRYYEEKTPAYLAGFGEVFQGSAGIYGGFAGLHHGRS